MIRINKIIAVGFCCLVGLVATAQKDTTKKQSIDITSSFKPVLRNSVKVNFSAAHINADTTKLPLNYKVPAQYLYYTYHPMSLKPLALAIDTITQLGLRNFIKAGYGNYATPYVKAGFSFGDGKNALVNVYADYISSKGKIPFQDYQQFCVKAQGSYFTERNEIYGGIDVNQNDNYLYGYDHSLYQYNKADLLQRFSTIELKAGFRNKDINETGIDYNPNLSLNLFTIQNRLSETNLIVEAPVQKIIDDVFTVKVSAKADITSSTTKKIIPNNIQWSNNIYSIAPALVYATPRLTLHGGVTPTWDNGKLNMLPNIYVEVPIANKPFLVQAGWVGRFIKNNYQNLTTFNPYLTSFLTKQKNTKELEFFAGLKSSIGSHFNYSAKASLLQFTNMALFINDTASDLKSFKISNESSLSDLRLHADMSYINQDNFSLTAGLTINGYTGLDDNAKAYGLPPMEMDVSLRWWAFKNVLLKTDFKALGGNPYLLPGNTSLKLKGGADLSAGIEVSITKKISAWFDINNVLNNKYQRWRNYEVYGLNVLTGFLLKF